MSWRRLGVLLRDLPPESRYATAVRNNTDPGEAAPPPPGIFGPWSQADMLLALIADRLGDLMFMQSDQKGRRPAPYPRPGTSSKVTPINEAAAAYLLEVERRHGEAPEAGWSAS